MKKQRRQQFDGGGGSHNDPTAAYYSRHSSHLPSRDPAHAVPDHATSATAAAAALNSQPQISSSRELSTANDNYDFTSNNGNRKYSHRRSHRYQSGYLRTIHLRRRQIFTMFDPYPLPSAFQQNAYEGDF